MGKFEQIATASVFMGIYIPSHDETHDLAESIGKQLDEFRAYVIEVRDEDQADAAVKELLTNLLAAATHGK